MAENGSEDFIKDLFIEKYGQLDSHRTWIKKNSKFVWKRKSDSGKYPPELSMKEFLALSDEDAVLYKEMPVIGQNRNPLISLEEYEALDKRIQKYYLVAEEVTERTERVKDTHGHIFVKHDLFNHDLDLDNPNPNHMYSQDGIAEAFAEFAKKEGLSFFP